MVRYRYARYRCGCCTEPTDVAGRYGCCTELPEVSGTGIEFCNRTGGTGINMVPNLPKCPVPVWMSYRTYRSLRYRYSCHTELTEVFGLGIHVIPNLPKCPVPALVSYRTFEVSGIGIDVPVPVPALVQTWMHKPAVFVQSIPGISRRYPLRYISRTSRAGERSYLLRYRRPYRYLRYRY